MPEVPLAVVEGTTVLYWNVSADQQLKRTAARDRQTCRAPHTVRHLVSTGSSGQGHRGMDAHPGAALPVEGHMATSALVTHSHLNDAGVFHGGAEEPIQAAGPGAH